MQGNLHVWFWPKCWNGKTGSVGPYAYARKRNLQTDFVDLLSVFGILY